MKIKSFIILLISVCLNLAFVSFSGDGVLLLVQKLEDYNKRFPQSKIHAFFNQDKFVPGDTAYFQTLLLNEDLVPATGPQIINIELVNQAGAVKYAQQIKVIDGLGSHRMIFPAELVPGSYLVRLYSNWMKNFDEAFQFRKTILIAGKNQFNFVQETVAPQVEFFPEGGSLIAGVKNKVAVRIQNVEASQGAIKDSRGTVVAAFSCDPKGLGTFSFAPVDGPYVAEFMVNGQVRRFKLPDAAQDGCSIVVAPYKYGNPVTITLSIPPSSRLQNQELIILLVSRSEVKFSTSIKIAPAGTSTVSLPASGLEEGIAQLYVFTEKFETLAERLLYVQKPGVQVRLNNLTSSLKTRTPETIDVTLTDENDRPLTGNFAIRIINKNVFSGSPVSIDNNLLWYSDVPASFMDGVAVSLKDSTLNDYLITQKWKRLNWTEISSDREKPVDYPVQTTLTWKGVAFNRESHDPLPDSSRIMAYLLNNAIGYEIMTRNNGSFELPIYFDFFDDDRLFYIAQFQGKEIKNVGIRLLRDSVTRYKAPEVTPGPNIDWYWDYTHKIRLINKSYSFFSAPTKKDTADFSDPNEEIEGELIGADITINMDEYVVFRTMEDVVREVVPTLQSHTVNGVTTTRLLLYAGLDNVIAPAGEPLYVIDGIMTKDTEFFMRLNPADIISIKLVRKVYKLDRFGILGKNGVVLIHTKNATLRNTVPHNTLVPLRGLNQPFVFEAPAANNSNLHIPEFRSTLYWNPAVKINSDGKSSFSFSTSDDTGPFILQLEGLTSDGRPFSIQKEFDVVLKSGNN